MRSASESPEDLTARARIRDAAIARFAEHGFRGTSMKQVATDAGVSQALVSHHFGSKDGLRSACDTHVVELISAQKSDVLRMGPHADYDVLAILREHSQGPPLIKYLARMLVDGSPHAAGLVDGMVGASGAAFEAGRESGIFRTLERPEDVSVVVTLWSLGILVLHEHAERLLGVDITGRPEDQVRYVRAASEALRGLFSDDFYTRTRDAFEAVDDRKEGSDE
jgi:TetR/AcrR family transcriptional regulator, regulator of cefoperazone and chloramphenicol sensitivity